MSDGRGNWYDEMQTIAGTAQALKMVDRTLRDLQWFASEHVRLQNRITELASELAACRQRMTEEAKEKGQIIHDLEEELATFRTDGIHRQSGQSMGGVCRNGNSDGSGRGAVGELRITNY